LEVYLKGLSVAYSGLAVTLQITIFAVIIGVVLGLIVALGKMSRFKLIKIIFSVYVELLRGTPPVVHIYQ
jgi:His/Glu/Gln/Arg/opine family amino acid ABC transporter permease subunit